MNKVNVLVTGAGGIGHGSSILKALLVSRLDFNIIVADANPRLLNTANVEIKELIPIASDLRYMESIITLVKKYSIDCIFTGSEQELMKLTEYKKEIEKYTKIFLNNKNVVDLCKNKILCNNKLDELGFNTPKSISVKYIDDVDKISSFPIVLKPNFDSGASANLYVAKSRDELFFMVTYLLSQKIDIIAQEYMEFNQNEYTVGIDSDLETGEIVGSIAMRKFLEGVSILAMPKDIVISSGVSQGEFKDFSNVKRACEEIAKGIGSTGPLNVQLRVINGKVQPFEINPRFSGTTSARAYTGYNQPEYYIRKYVLNDRDAKTSLNQLTEGYVVKGLDEKFVNYG